MARTRGFEVAKGFEDKEINLPVRKTKYSAGYDVEAAENCVVPAFKPGIAPTLIKHICKMMKCYAYTIEALTQRKRD